MAEQHPKALAPNEQMVPLWRNGDYLLLWGGQLISLLGTGISLLAFPLLVLALTHSPALAGGISAVRAVLFVLLGLPAGALVDRWDRKRTMIACDMVRAAALASLPVVLLLGQVSVLQVYLVALVEGVLFVFFTPAQSASLPQVVTPEQLPRAVSQNQISIGVLMLLGPLLSGVLFGINPALPFAADAATYAISFVTLLLMRRRLRAERGAPARDLAAEVRDGLRWLWQQPVMRVMALAFGGIYFVLTSGNLLLMVRAERMHAAPPLIGLIFTIGAVGVLVGALLGDRVYRRISLGRAMVGVLVLMALVWTMLAFTPVAWALGIVTAGLWMLSSITDVVWSTHQLALTPDALRGRVGSVFLTMVKAFEALGPALAGLALQYWSILPTVLLGTLWLIGLAVLVAASPQLRVVVAGQSGSASMPAG